MEEKMKNYSEVVQTAYGKCGGKSKPNFGDIKEFTGHLCELMVEDEKVLALLLKNGKNRIRRAKKKV